VKESVEQGVVYLKINCCNTASAPVAYDTFDPQSKAFDSRIKERTDVVQVHNLSLLKRYKVKVAFGSDRYGNTPVKDVLYIQKLGVFSNLEMLRIWCEDTPRTIFPNRKLGRLMESYEASFVVLGGNPLKDFAQVQNIKLRFKQGLPLMLQGE
jgi:imidazolonepropionase-like amidohydrolase